ncbi:MAG: hypothetical protein ACOZNI_17565, partial [Myxococcota bacterium]
HPRAGRVADVAALAVPAAVGPLAWGAYNRARGLDALGDRAPAATSLSENLRNLLDSTGDLAGARGSASVPLGAVVLAFTLAAAALTLRSARRRAPAEVAAAIFVPAYLVVVLGASTTTVVAELEDRFVAPLVVPATILFAFRVARRPLRVALAGVVVAALAVGAVRSAARAHDDGVYGFGTRRWATSETLGAVCDTPFALPVVSNQPNLLAARCGIAATNGPQHHRWRSEAPASGTKKLARLVAENGAVSLVWFDRHEKSYGWYTPEELAAEFVVTQTGAWSDGRMFEVRAR